MEDTSASFGVIFAFLKIRISVAVPPEHHLHSLLGFR
jgi:hypothetical protein